MIEVDHLTYEYPGLRALDDVSFSVREGSITALVGPNGAGKTTLLRCMAGLSRPYSGRIRLAGVDVVENPRLCHRLVGYLPDFFGLYDKLTVSQALTYFAMAHGVERREIGLKVTKILESVDLFDKARERVGGLSRGMRQRMALGQALVHDPPVLLLDEPASGLDPEARKALSDLLVSLNARGKTILVSSHILAELDEYATALLIIKNGALVKNVSEEAGEGADTPRLIYVGVLSAEDGLLERVKDLEGVSRAEISGKRLVLRFSGGEEKYPSLLAALLTAGAPVTSFYEERGGVQEQYLKTMANLKNDRKA